MSNIGLTCDVCGRVVQGITFMNGMKFCAKCYQETFGSGQPYKTVEKMWGDMYLELLKEHRELEQENKTKDERIAELEREVAEKDKEIEWLNLMINTLPNHDTEIEQQLRHKICEKIKSFFIENALLVIDNTIDLDCLWELLNNIERGEDDLYGNS